MEKFEQKVNGVGAPSTSSRIPSSMLNAIRAIIILHMVRKIQSLAMRSEI